MCQMCDEMAQMPKAVPHTIFEIDVSGEIPTEDLAYIREHFKTVLQKETDAIFHTPPKVSFVGYR